MSRVIILVRMVPVLVALHKRSGWFVSPQACSSVQREALDSSCIACLEERCSLHKEETPRSFRSAGSETEPPMGWEAFHRRHSPGFFGNGFAHSLHRSLVRHSRSHRVLSGYKAGSFLLAAERNAPKRPHRSRVKIRDTPTVWHQRKTKKACALL